MAQQMEYQAVDARSFPGGSSSDGDETDWTVVQGPDNKCMVQHHGELFRTRGRRIPWFQGKVFFSGGSKIMRNRKIKVMANAVGAWEWQCPHCAFFCASSKNRMMFSNCRCCGISYQIADAETKGELYVWVKNPKEDNLYTPKPVWHTYDGRWHPSNERGGPWNAQEEACRARMEAAARYAQS